MPRISAAAVGARIAAIELLDVKLRLAQSAAGPTTRTLRPQVAFVSGVPAPFAEAAPETAKKAFRAFCGVAHQSSPIASPTTKSPPAPEKSLAQRVAT